MLEEEKHEILRKMARAMGGGQVGYRNATNVLSVLGRDQMFVAAIETELGQQILKDAVSSIEDIVALYIGGNDTPEDRARLQSYLSIVSKWQKRILRYHDNKEKVRKAIKE